MNDAIRQQCDRRFSKAAKFSQQLLTASIAMVIASQQVSAAQPSTPAKTAGNFDEVIVTAQRRSELAVDVPISITAIDADQLVNSDIQQLGDIMKLTPALRFDETGGFSQPTIRGVGTSVVVAGGGSNVAIYTDGFYSPNPLMANPELLNVKNVQVLKGPQGTLFGRNSTGGAILVTTKEPSSQGSVDLKASYGSYNTQGYQIYATGGPSDALAFDIAGSLDTSDGFLHNIATGSNSDGEYNNSTIRLGAKWEASDKVSALLRYIHGDIDDAAPVNVNAYEKNGFVYSSAALLGANVATKPDEVSNGYKPSFTSQTDTTQLTVKIDLDFALLTSYTQYRDEIGTHHHDFDASALNIYHYKYDTTDKIFTQEFLLASSGDSRLQWTTGLFYFNDKTAFEKNSEARGNPTAIPPYSVEVPFVFTGGSGVTDNSIAAYGDATYALLNNLYLTAGLRYSKEKITDAYFDDPTTLNKVDVPDLDDNQLTPRVALRYEFDKNSSAYASYTEGFKSGILNVGGATLIDIKVKPEQIKAYEMGYKFSANSLMFDLATYYYDYKNLQVASYTVTNTGAVSVIQNAANSSVYGLDGQLRYAITNEWEMSLGAAYNHTKYDNFEKSQVWTPCPDPATCGTVFLPSYADASGNQMQHAPRFTGTLGLNYRTDLAEGSLNLSGTLYHTSDFYFDSANAYKQDAYDLLSLRAAWTDPSNHYTVALYGDNLTDEEYRTQVLPQFYGTLSTWGTPRTVGASLEIKY